MELLLDAVFSAVAFSHLGVDALNGTRAVLLVYLGESLALTNADIGLISTLYIVSAAIAQPIFGHLADRIGSRWIVVGGVLWTAVFFMLVLVVPGRTALILLIISSFGSGAFHPAGAAQATLRGRTRYTGREATVTSYFFLFGRVGYFLGPLLGGLLLSRFGLSGLFALAIPVLPIGFYAANQLRGGARTSNPSALQRSISVPSMDFKTLAMWAFIFLSAFQAMSEQNMITYVPKFLSDLGQPVNKYGVVSALFMGGSAVGDVIGGMSADRFGKRPVAFATFALASGPLFLLPHLGTSSWVFLIVPLAGALIGAAHSIIIVRAQHIIPGGMGLASGLILGFMFSSGAVGTYLSGHLADLYGFTPVFYLTGVICVAAAGLSMTLQE